MFWTDEINDRILRARLDGTDVVTIIDTGLCSPCKSTHYHNIIVGNFAGTNFRESGQNLGF